MMPFLKRKVSDAILIAKRQPDGSIEQEDDMDAGHEEGLKQCFMDLLRAIESKDVDMGTKALHAFFEMADSQEDQNEGEE